MILNLCRVLAYKKEGLILSKQEGGEWGIKNLSHPEYQKMISAALKEYQTGVTMSLDEFPAAEFAQFMLKKIK